MSVTILFKNKDMSTQLIAHLKKKCEADDNVKILLSQWEFDQKLVGKALENIGGFYPHFSNHNASHSQQILVNIERILGNDIDLLTATDTWLILEAAYWHDVGMLVDAKSAKDVHDNEDFKFMVKTIALDKGHDLHKFCLTYLDADWTGAIGSEDHPFDGVEKYRQLIAEWFRRNHDRRIGGLVEDPFKFLNITSPRTELLPKRIYRYLGQICMSHGMNFVDVLEKLPFKQTGLGTEDCHPRFIGCLLRLGDLFDLDDNRFCPVMAKHVSHQPSLSKVHEDKHLSLREFQLDKRTVKLVAECPNEMAYVETQNWFGWIREEFQNQMSQWNLIVPNEKFGSLPTIERLDVRMEIYYKDGIKREKILLDHKPMRFSVDDDKVIELVQGANVYSNEISIIREIYQNAIDATLIRIWLSEKNINWNETNPFDNSFRNILNKYPINIDLVKFEKENGESYWILKIEDNGIGINLDDLKYIQKIAGSSKNTNKKRIIEKMPKWLRPSGEFGIGLHSAFLLIDDLKEEDKKIEIITKSFFSNETLEILINSPLGAKKGYCFITKKENLERDIGLTININMKSRKFFSHNNRELKIDKGDFIFEKNFMEEAWKESFLKNIEDKILSKSIYSKKTLENVLWDKKRNFGYKFYFDEDNSFFDICYKGQKALTKNFHDFQYHGVGIFLDYYDYDAKECLNINRDYWKEDFSNIIKKDILFSLSEYLKNYKNPSTSMLKNMLPLSIRKQLDIETDDLWLKYKYKFKNENIKMKKLLDLDDFYIIDEDFRRYIDVDIISGTSNQYLVESGGCSIFRRLFNLKLLSEYRCYSIISIDDEENLFDILYFTKVNNFPINSINKYGFMWNEIQISNYTSTLENLYFDLRNVQEFIINKKYIDYSIMNCGVLVISDEEFIKGFEILSFSDNYFKYIINPYQISKNKIKLYDVDKMAYFIWENRADSFSEYTKEQYIKAYREFLNKLDIFIDSTDLRSYYHQ